MNAPAPAPVPAPRPDYAPAPRLAWLAALAALPLAGAAAWPEIVWAAAFFDLLLLLTWRLGVRRLRASGWRASRPGGGRGQRGQPTSWDVRLENPNGPTLRFALRQLPSPDWAPAPNADDPPPVDVPAGEAAVLRLSAVPQRRGTTPPPPLAVSAAIPGGWAAARLILHDTPPRVVYPELSALRQYDRLRTAGALSRLGVRRRRVVGRGREFERLRDYQSDDDYRQINWKATAKRGKPIVNVYQVERSQDVMLCLETGRLMGRPAGRGTVLDAAVDAALALAHAATREGDRAGLAAYGAGLDRYLPPRSGQAALRRVADALAALEPTGEFPSPFALAEALGTRQRKRSILFIWSDFGDPQLAADLAGALRPVARRHVTAVLGVRDARLADLAGGHPRDRRGLCDCLAARRLEEEREARMAELRRMGVDVVEADDAGALALAAVNRYLAVKARQRA